MNFSARLCFVVFILSRTSAKFIESVRNDDILMGTNELSYLSDQEKEEKVDVKVYYECMCPDCRNFDAQQLVPVVKKLDGYLNLHMVPYGNAETHEHDDKVDFKCQHGPEECYGNKLHACVIDALQNITEAILFNACMMDYSQEGRGSDDKAADVCGKSMGLDTKSIKECAKGDRGTVLLKQYGEESALVDFNFVPYILVNGRLTDGTDFMKTVCNAFKNPPQACKDNELLYRILMLFL